MKFSQFKLLCHAAKLWCLKNSTCSVLVIGRRVNLWLLVFRKRCIYLMFTLCSFAPLWLPYVDQQGNKISTLKKKEREKELGESSSIWWWKKCIITIPWHGAQSLLGFHFMSI